MAVVCVTDLEVFQRWRSRHGDVVAETGYACWMERCLLHQRDDGCERAVGRPCLRLETIGFFVVDAPSAPAAELKAAVAVGHWWIARKLADECA